MSEVGMHQRPELLASIPGKLWVTLAIDVYLAHRIDEPRSDRRTTTRKLGRDLSLSKL